MKTTAKKLKTSSVTARTKSAQVKSTRKPATSITPQAEESRKSGAAEIVDVIEHVDFIAPETPLSSSSVSKLCAGAKNYVQLARTFGGSKPTVDDDYFSTRLALLQACLEASKSGKFSLSKEETKRCAGVIAVKMFQEVREWAEMGIEKGREVLKGAL
jgi:hypothetical protein